MLFGQITDPNKVLTPQKKQEQIKGATNVAPAPVMSGNSQRIDKIQSKMSNPIGIQPMTLSNAAFPMDRLIPQNQPSLMNANQQQPGLAPTTQQTIGKAPEQIQDEITQDITTTKKISADQLRVMMQRVPDREQKRQVMQGLLERGYEIERPEQVQTGFDKTRGVIDKIPELPNFIKNHPVLNMAFNVKDFASNVVDTAEGLSNSVSNRMNKVGDATSAANRGDISQAEGLTIGTLQAIGVLPDAIGEAFMMGVRQLDNTIQGQGTEALNRLGETEVGQRGIQALGEGMEAYNGWATENPNDARRLEALLVPVEVALDLIGGSGVKQGVKQGAKQIAKQGDNAVGRWFKNVAEKGLDKVGDMKLPSRIVDKDRIIKESNNVVGKIIQGDIDDIPSAINTLKDIDIKGIQTYKDLGDVINARSKNYMELVDKRLLEDTKTYKPKDTKHITKVGETSISQEPVVKAIRQLDELYTKIDDPVSLAKIKEINKKFNADGLSLYEINNIAREYNSVFKNKAFSKVGDPLTSVNAQAFENNRTAIKNLTRKKMGDKITQQLDKQYSDAINTKRLIDNMTKKVNNLSQKIQERGLLEKVMRKIGRGVDLATMGGLRGFLTSFLPSNIGNKVLNSLDLQSRLRKHLNILDDLIKKTDKGNLKGSDIKNILDNNNIKNASSNNILDDISIQQPQQIDNLLLPNNKSNVTDPLRNMTPNNSKITGGVPKVTPLKAKMQDRVQARANQKLSDNAKTDLNNPKKSVQSDTLVSKADSMSNLDIDKMSISEQFNMFEKNSKLMEEYFSSKKLPVNKVIKDKITIPGVDDDVLKYINSRDKIHYTEGMINTISDDMKYRTGNGLPDNVVSRQNKIDKLIKDNDIKVRKDSKGDSYVLKSDIEKAFNKKSSITKELQPPYKSQLEKLKNSASNISKDEFISKMTKEIDTDLYSEITIGQKKIDKVILRSELNRKYPKASNRELVVKVFGEIREEANPKIIPTKTIPLKSKSVTKSKELQPLYDEARKYNSADEFVKAQGTKTDFLTQKKLSSKYQDFINPKTGEYDTTTFGEYLKIMKEDGGKIIYEKNIKTREMEFSLYNKYGGRMRTPKITKQISEYFDAIDVKTETQLRKIREEANRK